jgi:hypothetical protein
MQVCIGYVLFAGCVVVKKKVVCFVRVFVCLLMVIRKKKSFVEIVEELYE